MPSRSIQELKLDAPTADELQRLRNFVFEVYWEDSGLAIWNDAPFEPLLAYARKRYAQEQAAAHETT